MNTGLKLVYTLHDGVLGVQCVIVRVLLGGVKLAALVVADEIAHSHSAPGARGGLVFVVSAGVAAKIARGLRRRSTCPPSADNTEDPSDWNRCTVAMTAVVSSASAIASVCHGWQQKMEILCSPSALDASKT